MRVLIAAALLTLGAAAPHQALPGGPAPRLARIDMATTSWGKPVATWSIDAHGTLTYTAPEPNWSTAERMVTRRYEAGTAGFRRIRLLLGRAETRGTREGRELPCTINMTDQESGTVTWTQPNTRAISTRFYTACREFATREVVRDIRRADALAATWAKAGTVTETRKVERP